MPNGLGLGEYKKAVPLTLPAGPPRKPPATPQAPARPDDDRNPS